MIRGTFDSPLLGPPRPSSICLGKLHLRVYLVAYNRMLNADLEQLDLSKSVLWQHLGCLYCPVLWSRPNPGSHDIPQTDLSLGPKPLRSLRAFESHFHL